MIDDTCLYTEAIKILVFMASAFFEGVGIFPQTIGISYHQNRIIPFPGFSFSHIFALENMHNQFFE